MYYFTLNNSSTTGPINLYGKLNYLKNIIETNNNRLDNYVEFGNLVLPNQNALVEFLMMFSIDPDWDEEYLYNIIASKANRNGSNCNFNTLFNRGVNFTNTIFPEKDHNTFFVIPFGENNKSIQYYKDLGYKLMCPFRTIYSTDTLQRYNVANMLLSANVKNRGSEYTIVQIDPFELCFGYYYYLKERIRNNRIVGLSPHAYILKYPIANFYKQHNGYIIFNYLNNETNSIEIEDTPFNKIDYSNLLKDFIKFQESTLGSRKYDGIWHFIKQVGQLNTNDTLLSVYPDVKNSLSFKQLACMYNYGNLHIARIYLNYCELLGFPDGRLNNNLNTFYKENLNSVTTTIKDVLWLKHFKDIYNEVKELY